ncbi:hypothetical protein MODO_2511 [Myroides odoratimimus]|uniref:hypothetical protein n=1 Tax=Myroides odoratimimus TaxID=76832 RepID=UPI000723E5F4|nr:hypothetical protein [Myroides odoratimimus]GAQ14819.1 hypothetical protein MODO_2511 [Myroides odoratimimus]STZ48876.1 Uncharacterised protein [Myroides odoratimimus]
MIHNLFLVASPFQLVCAVEAMQKLCTKENNILVLFESLNNKQNLLLRNVLEEFDSEYELIVIKQDKSYKMFFNKIRLLKSLSTKMIDKLFIGHLDEFFNKLFICNIRYNYLVNLDDGAATLYLFEKYNNLDRICAVSTFKDSIKCLVSDFIYRLRKEKELTIKWFTIFDLKGDNVISNNLDYVRNHINKKSTYLSNNDDFSLYFIGSNIVKANVILNGKCYVELLDKYFTHLSSREQKLKIYYLPHRFENVDQLEEIINKFNITIIEHETIIEIYMLKNGITPSKIASFYSTALYSLKAIFTSADVEFLRIPKEKLNDSFKEKVSLVQDLYEKVFSTFK